MVQRRAKTKAVPARHGKAARAQRAPERIHAAEGWRSTDEQEIERRRERGTTEPLAWTALEPDQPVFGTFRVGAVGGRQYEVEIRSLTRLDNSCGCLDHRINGLGTCKHVEAVVAHLRRNRRLAFESPRLEIFLRRTLDGPRIEVLWPAHLPRRAAERVWLSPFFAADGTLAGAARETLPELFATLDAAGSRRRAQVRLSRHLLAWWQEEGRRLAGEESRRRFLAEVESGRQSLDWLKLPLYPYQRQGMLHLALTGRALLADEMGLGKTVQAIGAAELLARLAGIERVLVVSPASLKTEWEEQIAKFTDRPIRLVQGTRASRLGQYGPGAFFYLVHYEQVLADFDAIEERLAPDLVILDEAQRIKNWQAKTAQAVKRLESPYAFVLTGTPLENRIDELYSIVQFLDPTLFGPLFRFNRDFYELDDRGRPVGTRNLGELSRRLAPVFLRRRKDEVEGQLPGRTDKHYFVPMDPEQELRYQEVERRVARLAAEAARRPLTPAELAELQRRLSCLRMLCDTPYILDADCRVCPKLVELREILGEVLADPKAKVLIFSEWVRMLELVRGLAGELEVGFAWHTGSVPTDERRREIRRFKDDPACRLFLSTDSGGVGLNLQAANVVVHLDLPWNPAKLEQRTARAWRKHQTRPVQVLYLVTEESIEHRMIPLLERKQSLADRVLDGKGEADAMPLPSGRRQLVERLEAILGKAPKATPASEPLGDGLVQIFGARLSRLEVRTAGDGGEVWLAVVDSPAAAEVEHAQAIAKERGNGVRLELLDRGAYEALERLVAAGIFQPPPPPLRTLQAPPPAKDPIDPRKLARARDLVAQGERKVRMAGVLAGNGFTAEALEPLREGVERSLSALGTLDGDDLPDGEGEPLPVPRLPELLARHRLAVDGTLAWIECLRGGATTALVLTEEEARAAVEKGGPLCREIAEAVERAAR